MSNEFRWVRVNSKDEMEAFYRSIIGKIREAAEKCGYAIGVHGSLRRDMDLIAVAWREGCSDKNELARQIHLAACGLQNQSYIWEKKPLGRMAVSFPVCFPEDFPECHVPNSGHIDLSVAPAEELTALRARVERYREALIFIADGCLVPPDGGDPRLSDAIECAKEALRQGEDGK